MRLTKETHILMRYFANNNCIAPPRQTKQTNNLLSKLYLNIRNGVSYIQETKSKMGKSFYNLKINHITNINQIPKPTTFSSNTFPESIRNHINEYSLNSLTYDFHIFDRNIRITFIIEDQNVEMLINKYNTYVDYMLVWLYIVNLYSSKSCANDFKIFIYHTSLLKTLPNSNVYILDQMNINTGFTRTCSKVAEIILFRKEEWFKVFMHETFHTFALDFSNINSTLCNENILRIFPVQSEVNLDESYSEFWARIMNALFCSFIHTKDKNNVNEFLENASFFIHLERIYSLFQMIKVLKFMGLTYTDLFKKNALAENLRKTLYKENTNVLSYYIIGSILINNYQDFLGWCHTNNPQFVTFKKTNGNLYKYCDFIEKKYKTKHYLNDVKCSENVLYKLTKQRNKEVPFIAKTLRMTMCELG